jgi:hypothetical protein
MWTRKSSNGRSHHHSCHDFAQNCGKISEENVSDHNTKQALYQYLLKAVQARLAQSIPNSEADMFAHLSLSADLNLLFLIKGEWGSLGDYVTTQRAVRALVGDDLLWAEPQKPTVASVGVVQ